MTWYGDKFEPKKKSYSLLELLRIGIKVFFLIFLISSNLILFVVLRFIEKNIINFNLSPSIVSFVSRLALRVVNIKFTVVGNPMKEKGCAVANHVSWLDIFCLSAVQDIVFVSKADVANWIGIGTLAKIVGVLFISRKRNAVIQNNKYFRDRLIKGERLLFFPEGTSTDGLQVLPFKPTLFEAIIKHVDRSNLYVQGISLVYSAPKLEDKRFYGWWGHMEFFEHIFVILSTNKKGSVTIYFHSPRQVSMYKNRKALATALHNDVSSVFTEVS